jgi:hypothetical protein
MERKKRGWLTPHLLPVRYGFLGCSQGAKLPSEHPYGAIRKEDGFPKFSLPSMRTPNHFLDKEVRIFTRNFHLQERRVHSKIRASYPY